MRRKVCYTFRRMGFHAMKRLYALKEGFNVKSGNSLKVVCLRGCCSANRMAEEGTVFRSF